MKLDEFNVKLNNLKSYAKDNFVPIMLEDSLKLLLNTVVSCNPKKVLEIGTAIGYTAINILNVCNCHVYTIEIDEAVQNIAKQNFSEFGVYDRVTTFLGDAKEIVQMLTGSFDFILLDGPKGYYTRFLPKLLKLLNIGGVLFADNVLYKGMVKGAYTPKHRTIAVNLKEFLNTVTTLDCLQTTVVDVGDGIAICKKAGEFIG